MSRLKKKFLLVISLILIVIIGCSLFINHFLVRRYYLYQKRHEVNELCLAIAKTQETPEDTIAELEQLHKVVIVQVPDPSDNDIINERLRKAFLDKGLGLEKFWLWEQDYESALTGQSQLRIYRQNRLNYSLLVGYTAANGYLYGVAMVIPDTAEMIRLIGLIQLFVFAAAIVVMIFLVSIFIDRIIHPLSELNDAAKEITKLNFVTKEIRTGDEIEVLADSINQMSESLDQSNQALIKKNRQMEELLNNVSHEFKTPLALTRAYLAGIRDGIDDGTFLQTIEKQNRMMSDMLEQLLHYSRIAVQQIRLETVSLTSLLNELVEEFQVLADQDGIVIRTEIDRQINGQGDPNGCRILFSNLLSNALKYTAGHHITLTLRQENETPVFTISNPVIPDEIELEKIWEPFYVGESSRSKELSGTGLGLSIVKELALKQNLEFQSSICGDQIIFTIRWQKAKL